MSATKILWGQIAVVFAIVLVTMWAATQWTAWRLGYQPQLGRPWFELAAGVPIYLPPAFFWWWYAFDAYAPAVFVEAACVAASGGIIVVALAISVWRAREAETAATYGRLARSSTYFSWNVSRDSRYGWYPKQEKSTFRGKIARCLRRVVARR
jgi:type IV secretion system protein VirD4